MEKKNARKFNVIKLSDLINPSAIVFKRFDFGGRWFDDVVDNNARRAS